MIRTFTQLKKKTIFLVCLLVFGTTAIHSQTSWNPVEPGTCGGNCITPLNGNGTLGQVYNFSKCGLNYTTVSQRLGQRFSPAGVLQPASFVVNLPPCISAANGNIEKAFLWCGTSGNG